MKNLLEETREVLAENGYCIEDVAWVGCGRFTIPVATFLEAAGTEYDSDREEVVRCRDCEKAIVSGAAMTCDSFAVWDGSEWDRPHVEPDGFCAWGKRREAR